MMRLRFGSVATVTVLLAVSTVLTALPTTEYAAATPNATVSVDWNNVVAISNSTTTLQVVANPLLNPKTCPIAEKYGQTLANLGADLVRYVPWFPYPKVGVAELDPPNYNNKTAFWRFDDIIPQLQLFMNATYEKGHTVIPNFSTQPTWMYDTNDWSYPADPNTVDFGYPRGNANPNTTKLVADYYGRLLSWIVRGEFVDEFGNTHTGGPKYNLTHWEVFNEPEGCHGLNYDTYTQQYDAVVQAIRQNADPEHRIKFVGLALAGRRMDWISYFLNQSNHAPGTPLDYASFHFYANCANRTDPQNYEDFFSAAAGFLDQAKQIDQIRRSLSPNTKLSCDEMGVILPDDNNPNSPVPPRIYWNAAGAMYAYLVGEMSKIGIEILGESQLAGSPPIPEWDIPEPQYPSVALVNWTTGEGNARYWVLKLLIDEVGPGDKLMMTSTSSAGHGNLLCGKVNGHSGYGNITLQCNDPSATINRIDFAAFGTPTGTCGSYQRGQCDAKNVTSTVEKLCMGKNSCNVGSYPFFGDPCYQVYKSLIIQAECSGSKGGKAMPCDGCDGVYSQAWLTKAGAKKVLVVNKKYAPATVVIDGGAGATVKTVDEATGDGPAREDSIGSDQLLSLAPYAVSMVTLKA